MHEHILHEKESFEFASVRYVGLVKRKKNFVFKLQMSHFTLFCELFREFWWKGGLSKVKSVFVSGTHNRNLSYMHG